MARDRAGVVEIGKIRGMKKKTSKQRTIILS